MTFNLKWHEISNDMKSQMTWNLTRYEISKDMKSQMIWNLKWHEMSKGTKYQISWNVKYHKISNIIKCWCWIYYPKQKHSEFHTSERTLVPQTAIFRLGTLVPNYICLKFLFKLWHYLLAPPSGALVVSQFQDPASPIPSHPTYRFGCSKLCSNVPDWIWQSVKGQ